VSSKTKSTREETSSFVETTYFYMYINSSIWQLRGIQNNLYSTR
jgi:hypothetical protein